MELPGSQESLFKYDENKSPRTPEDLLKIRMLIYANLSPST
jgi:hypothetical protein